jgi:hypothetical protein
MGGSLTGWEMLYVAFSLWVIVNLIWRHAIIFRGPLLSLTRFLDRRDR